MNSNQIASPCVLIVMLNWNNASDTKMAVESVLGMDYDNFRILIIDNGSLDNSVSELRQITGSRVELLESPVNTGYTGGCNLGLTRALEMNVDYVWLLNNDTVVPAQTLASIVRLAQTDERIGLVSPLVASLEDKSRFMFAGAVFSKENAYYDVTADIKLAQDWVSKHPGKTMLLGTALLVRTQVIRDVGMMDDAFFAYWEDIDYSARTVEAGYRNIVDFGSVVYHSEKYADTKPLDVKPHYWYYMARNECRFWRKHVGFIRSLKPTWWSFHRFLRYFDLCRDSATSCDAILCGLWHGWTHRSGIYRPRYRMPILIAKGIRVYGRKYMRDIK